VNDYAVAALGAVKLALRAVAFDPEMDEIIGFDRLS
jgi:hypothetical protein